MDPVFFCIDLSSAIHFYPGLAGRTLEKPVSRIPSCRHVFVMADPVPPDHESRYKSIRRKYRAELEEIMTPEEND